MSPTGTRGGAGFLEGDRLGLRAMRHTRTPGTYGSLWRGAPSGATEPHPDRCSADGGVRAEPLCGTGRYWNLSRIDKAISRKPIGQSRRISLRVAAGLSPPSPRDLLRIIQEAVIPVAKTEITSQHASPNVAQNTHAAKH